MGTGSKNVIGSSLHLIQPRSKAVPQVFVRLTLVDPSDYVHSYGGQTKDKS
jgi:hypothetical protein